jgi:hypothetical protein
MKKIEKVRPVVIVKVCSGALLFNAMKKMSYHYVGSV